MPSGHTRRHLATLCPYFIDHTGGRSEVHDIHVQLLGGQTKSEQAAARPAVPIRQQLAHHTRMTFLGRNLQREVGSSNRGQVGRLLRRYHLAQQRISSRAKEAL